MRTLFNSHELFNQIAKKAIVYSIVPLAYFIPVFAFSIPIESVYDYLLEVTRLYCVILIASLVGKLVKSRVIKIGLVFAVFNGAYDAITEIIAVDNAISEPFPFADALLDEALLIAAYGCVIYGLYHHFKKVNTLSLTDNLTGAYTRSALDLIPVGQYQLFYFDLDDFKQINDTQGHNYGDHVLKTFSEHMIKACGDSGYILRFGGDEFIALIDTNNAQSFIDAVEHASDGDKIKFSYGTAACTHNDYKAAIIEADENLYQMKKYRKSDYEHVFGLS